MCFVLITNYLDFSVFIYSIKQTSIIYPILFSYSFSNQDIASIYNKYISLIFYMVLLCMHIKFLYFSSPKK